MCSSDPPTSNVSPCGRSDEARLERLLRDLHRPQEEWEFEQTLERILDLVSDRNFTWVMNALPTIDPLAERNPGSVPGMRLLLMDELVRTRGRCLEESLELLPSVRSDFEKIGDSARVDLQETDALMAHIKQVLSH